MTAANSTAGTYSKVYGYDSKTRLSTEAISIPVDATYTYTRTYNATTGLLDTLQYPVSASAYQLKLQYTYANGILKEISDFAAGTAYCIANTTNPRGQITQETLGNGVIVNHTYDAATGWLGGIQAGHGGGSALQNNAYLFDAVGNVMQRQDNNLGITENAYYDNLYRLDHTTLTNHGTNLQMSYDATGNILTWQLDGASVNTQNFTIPQAGCSSYVNTQPHAVRQSVQAAFTSSNCYDANGNTVTNSTNGIVDETIDWTSFNQPATITGGINSSSTIFYDDNHQRYKQNASYSGAMENTFYIGGLMEKVAAGGSVAYRHYIPAGNNTVLYTRSTGSNLTYYITKDHLGSSSVITDSTGALVVTENFPAYGSFHRGDDWTRENTTAEQTAIANISRRGFTGHEMLDNVYAVNMNGRIFSGIAFLSPDPHVPDPRNTQSFNRYSYVNNNPLSRIDPSGFDETGLPELIVTAGGGPEDPYTDVAAGVVEIASDIGLGHLFSGLFGSGAPHLSAAQQAFVNHGGNLQAPLPQITVTAQAAVVPASQAQIASFGFAGFNASINSPGDLNTAARNGVGDMSDTSPGSINAFDAHPNFEEIEVDAIRGGGFNYAGIGRSAAFLAAAPWMKLAAIGVLGTSGAYVGGNLLGPELAVTPMVRPPPPDLGGHPPGWNSNWEFRFPEGGAITDPGGLTKMEANGAFMILIRGTTRHIEITTRGVSGIRRGKTYIHNVKCAMQTTSEKIRLAFFDASDGPRIMLFGPLDIDILALQDCFRKLAKGCDEIEFDRLSFIVPIGGIRLVARCTGEILLRSKAEHRQGILKLGDNPYQFEWSRSAEGWDYLAELLDGLVRCDGPAHQYLTRYPDEDAIVVVSKGEYADDVVSKATRPT